MHRFQTLLKEKRGAFFSACSAPPPPPTQVAKNTNWISIFPLFSEFYDKLGEAGEREATNQIGRVGISVHVWEFLLFTL